MKDSAFESFSESAQDALDFARCQRPDGSFYGTGGQCKKGSPAGAKEKAAPKGRAKGGGDAVAPAPKKTTSKDPVKSVLKSQKETSDWKKKDDAAMVAKNPALKKQMDEARARKAKLKAAQEGGATSTKAQTASDIKAKRAEVRAMDKTAKAADKAADKADKKFQKSKSPADQKEARRLDKEAKSANKEASKADRELQRMAKSAKSAKGRESNVSLNKALATDGPKPTGSQRAAAMKVLRQQENTLKNIEAKNGSLTKPQQARLKLIKASQRSYEIDGKQTMKAQTK